MRRTPFVVFIIVSTLWLGCSGMDPPPLGALADAGANAGGDAGGVHTGAIVVDDGGGSSSRSSRGPVNPDISPGTLNQGDPAPSSSSASAEDHGGSEDHGGREKGKGDGGGRKQHQGDDG